MVLVKARLFAVIVISATALFAVTGCTDLDAEAGPVPTTTAVTTPSASPTEPPAIDPIDTVVSVVLLPETFDLRDASGAVVASHSYLGDVDEAIASLDTVFGVPSVDTPYDGSNHTPPGIRHTWGAVELDERHYDEQRRVENGYGLVWPHFAVSFDAPAYDGVALTSATGAVVGMPWPEYATVGVPNPGWSCVGPLVDLAVVTESEAVGPQTYGVALGPWWNVEPDTEVVTWIGAPYVEADGCA
ncbi:hypothetical protein ACGGZK_15850 [Agromyces sp. MMS24-K17]|uniref:hypothetical protein n=1 Tax=Agromyces sp. MMS24-K17 TaxID=3372850 RepID=UPI003754FD22